MLARSDRHGDRRGRSARWLAQRTAQSNRARVLSPDETTQKCRGLKLNVLLGGFERLTGGPSHARQRLKKSNTMMAMISPATPMAYPSALDQLTPCGSRGVLRS